MLSEPAACDKRLRETKQVGNQPDDCEKNQNDDTQEQQQEKKQGKQQQDHVRRNERHNHVLAATRRRQETRNLRGAVLADPGKRLAWTPMHRQARLIR